MGSFSTGSSSLRRFEAGPCRRSASYLRNRALRILPAYWVILIAVVIVFQRELLTRPLELLANLFLVQNYVPAYVVGGDEGFGIVPAWSLVIEVSFYVPRAGTRIPRDPPCTGGSHALPAALVPVVGHVCGRLAAKVFGRSIESSDLLKVWSTALPSHADWFAAGMAIAVARVLYEDGRLPLRRVWVGVAAGAPRFSLRQRPSCTTDGRLNGLEQQTPYALLFALLLGFVALSAPHSRTVRWLSCGRSSSWASRRTVSSSFTIRSFADSASGGGRLPERSGFVANLALIGVVSVAVAIASYLYVERPALARKRSWQAGTSRASARTHQRMSLRRPRAVRDSPRIISTRRGRPRSRPHGGRRETALVGRDMGRKLELFFRPKVRSARPPRETRPDRPMVRVRISTYETRHTRAIVWPREKWEERRCSE